MEEEGGWSATIRRQTRQPELLRRSEGSIRPRKCIRIAYKTAHSSQLINDEEIILSRWREHFDSLFNRPSVVKPGTIEGLQQAEIVHGTDNQRSKEEISKAVHQTKPGKSPGIGGISPRSSHSCWTSTLQQASFSPLTNHGNWEVATRIQRFLDTTIHRKKGEHSDWNNYRGISLLAIAGKILARILLRRMVKHIADPNLSESQTGFRANRGTTDYLCISSTPR